MPKTTTKPNKTKTNESLRARPRRTLSKSSAFGAVVTMGCPSGVGPELLARLLEAPVKVPLIFVGDRGALRAAAESAGVDVRLVDDVTPYAGGVPVARFSLLESSSLGARDRRPGKPSRSGGVAQLHYIEAGYRVAKELGWPLVTAPVSKEAIAHSGESRLRSFTGHTEWLERLDRAPFSVMCFASPKLLTSLVTTHVPLKNVPKALTPERVARAITALAELSLVTRPGIPKIAVCSLNPHAGEGELLGTEERTAIVPGLSLARKQLKARVLLEGPVGAETAYRKGAGGAFDGVVAMYHDQATIPMKLLDFGGAVNVTMGLSILRTSVDHGTAYDIAGKGLAKLDGLWSALELALRLDGARRVPPKRAVRARL